jgi:DNA-binding protein HU-beta
MNEERNINMNKTELIASVANAAGVTKKDAERIVNATFDTIAAQMAAGERVQVSGFGIFETKQRQARVGRNPLTKEAIEIPASTLPTFKPAKALKDAVSK